MSESSNIIQLDLAPEYLPRLSSNGYSRALISALSTCDAAYTLGPRYFKLADDITGRDRQGVIIDYTGHNHWAFALLTSFYAGLGIYSFVKDVKRQIKEHRRQTSYKKIAYTLPLFVSPIPDVVEDDGEFQSKVAAWFVDKPINSYMQQALRIDAYLFRQYKEVKVVEDVSGKRIQFTVRKPKPKRTLLESAIHRFKSIISPIWEGLSNASFAYWIFWIAASIYTGSFALAGIAGVPAVIAFGLPILLGLVYPIIKSLNYFRRKKKTVGAIQDVAQMKVAEEVANTLTQRALDRQHADLAEYFLQEEINKYKRLNGKSFRSVEPNIFGFSKDGADSERVADHEYSVIRYAKTGMGPAEKAGLTFVIRAPAMFVGVQYASWIVTDFLNVVLNVSTVDPTGIAAGATLGVVSLVFGAYQAYKAFVETKEEREKIRALQHDQELTFTKLQEKQELVVRQLREKVAAINNLLQGVTIGEGIAPGQNRGNYLRSIIADLRNSEFVAPPKPPSTLGEKLFRWVDGSMTGIFFARLFAVPGSAIFMFCMLPSLINPFLLTGLLLVAGTSFAYMKYKQFNDDAAKAEAKERLLKAPEEHLRAKQQLKQAELCLELLQEEKRYVDNGLAPLNNSNDNSEPGVGTVAAGASPVVGAGVNPAASAEAILLVESDANPAAAPGASSLAAACARFSFSAHSSAGGSANASSHSNADASPRSSVNSRVASAISSANSSANSSASSNVSSDTSASSNARSSVSGSFDAGSRSNSSSNINSGSSPSLSSVSRSNSSADPEVVNLVDVPAVPPARKSPIFFGRTDKTAVSESKDTAANNKANASESKNSASKLLLGNGKPK